MTIPESIQILGKTITVHQNVDSVAWDLDYGQADVNNLTIQLAGTLRGKPMPQSQVEHTFFHELVHHWMWVMGEKELFENEQFVDLLGSLMHQGLAPHMK